MSRCFRPLFIFPLFLLFFNILIMTSPADAASEVMSIIQQIEDTSHQESAEKQQNTEIVNKAIISATDKIKEAIATGAATEQAQKTTAAPDEALQKTLFGLPLGLSVVDKAARDVLTNRLAELNLIKLNDEKSALADYLVDTGVEGVVLEENVKAQMLDIYMRYFCDTKARAGTLGKLGTSGGVKIISSKYPAMYLGCGSVRQQNGGIAANPSYKSRDQIFGEEPETAPTDVAGILKEQQRGEIKNLSVKMAGELLTPKTFPIMPIAGDSNVTNTNPLAPVYYGAFAQALQLLIGSAADIGKTDLSSGSIDPSEYVSTQGKIARYMLASYPLAQLFAEQVGSLDEDVAKATGKMLLDKLGPVTADSAIYNKVSNLRNRKNLSIAEYMDIVMYQVPMSPGYLARINTLTPEQLQREKVWLIAQQTALNYKRNKWLEILAALEAVKGN